MAFSRRPISIGDALKTIINECNLQPIIIQGKLPDVWREVVGDTIADSVSIVKLKDGTLFLSAASSSWKSEILLRRHDLINKINDKFQSKIVNKIFVIDK